MSTLIPRYLAQSLLRNFRDNHPAYLNWDDDEAKRKIRAKEWPKSETLIVLDEIHKFRGWRDLVKGFYDTLKNTTHLRWLSRAFI